MDGGDSAGGSAELAELIDAHGESLHFDFLRYTPYKLSDLLDPESGLTPRSAIAIIRQLPNDSAFSASIRGGGEFKGWDLHAYLLANLVDAVQQNTWAFVSANSKKGKKPPKPEPVERPKSKKAAAKKKDPAKNTFAAMARLAYGKSSNKEG